MTAEIAILNRSGVALAADSAATLQSANGPKISNSANKLFALSKFHPVGIMLYGDSAFMGTPWELIIKVYRDQLADTQFERLEEYATDFIDFLNNDRTFSPESIQQKYFLDIASRVFYEIKNTLDKKVTTKIQSGSGIKEEEVPLLLNETINEVEKKLVAAPILESANEEANKKWLDQQRPALLNLRGQVLEKLPISEVTWERICTLLQIYLNRAFFVANTGLVFAGYGSDEVFPSVKSFIMEGVINNTLRYNFNVAGSVAVDFDIDARIVPYAQSDMVFAFSQGIDPSLQQVYDGFLDSVVTNFPAHVLEASAILTAEQKTTLTNEFSGAGEQLKKIFRDKVQNHQFNSYIGPLLRIISSLPKDELAAVAESLVNLTSFKRKVSLDAETVGGPIDVAVISKGDGFVWIKRKHYFDSERNPLFSANYLRSKTNKRRGKNAQTKKAVSGKKTSKTTRKEG